VIYFAAALIAYLLGSIPFGFIAGRIAGTDVRQHGSGNIGATNTLRVLGKKYGYAVFVADVLKGFLPVRIALWLANSTRPPAISSGSLLLCSSWSAIRFLSGLDFAVERVWPQPPAPALVYCR